MRLPLGSRALRRRSRLLHPVYRRAPLDGTAGLRNPVSCDPVRERGDKVFGERSSATAGLDIDTEADDYFPNDDFFPDISNLFSDMALNSDNANAGSSSGPYVFLPSFYEIMMFFLLLATCSGSLSGNILLLSISLDLLLLYSMVICMTSLISTFLVMFYLLFSLIKSWGNLLIIPTHMSIARIS